MMICKTLIKLYVVRKFLTDAFACERRALMKGIREENPIKSRPIYHQKLASKRRADAHIGDFNPSNESTKLAKAPGP